MSTSRHRYPPATRLISLARIKRYIRISALCFLAVPEDSFAQNEVFEDKPYVPTEAVVRGVTSALSDPNKDVVKFAIQKLGEWKQPSPAGEIVKLITRENPSDVRTEALHYFVQLGAKAAPFAGEIAKLLSEDNPTVRAWALDAIRVSGEAAIHSPAIAPLLQDPSADVQGLAVQCIGRAGRSAQIYKVRLIEALPKAGGADVKASLLDALGEIGGLSEAQIDSLLLYLGDANAEVRIAAAVAISRTILEAKAESDPNRFNVSEERLRARYRSESPQVQAAIIAEIARDKRSVEMTIKALTKSIEEGGSDAKAAALFALSKAGDAALPHLPMVVGHLKGPTANVRAGAFAVLRGMGAKVVQENVTAIAEALLDEEGEVRNEALLAAEMLGTQFETFPYKFKDVYLAATPAVRETLLKAAAIRARSLGMSPEYLAGFQSAFSAEAADMRVAAAFVAGRIGSEQGKDLQPLLVDLLRDADAAVRGAGAIALRSYASSAESKMLLRQQLRPLLKDADENVRWAAADTLHEADPAFDKELLADLAALLKDSNRSVRQGAVRALAAGGAAAKPYLSEIVGMLTDDPATPPYGAADAILNLGSLTAGEIAILLGAAYIDSSVSAFAVTTAYAASGGDPATRNLIRLLAPSKAAALEVIKPDDIAATRTFLSEALKAPKLHPEVIAKIEARLAELK